MTRCYLGEGGGNDYDDNIGDGGHVDDDGHGNGGGDKARLYASLRQFKSENTASFVALFQ